MQREGTVDKLTGSFGSCGPRRDVCAATGGQKGAIPSLSGPVGLSAFFLFFFSPKAEEESKKRGPRRTVGGEYQPHVLDEGHLDCQDRGACIRQVGFPDERRGV